ncbi:MAG: hypothetical protein OMM_11284 [Candidatus Magnetoglobus multicellularis str. Araruama]|uniref:Uncharacterized protein n=1 Tax=Candidatus Magnetoglobus multicellularis str. Araruama TaxID=890399 RepID=A0A1V1NYQ3_9BACT|nr:MAG: hypothetical protein OMM_11284 [Candidatus Magnetoglobus multicellularis str. Araruama]
MTGGIDGVGRNSGISKSSVSSGRQIFTRTSVKDLSRMYADAPTENNVHKGRSMMMIVTIRSSLKNKIGFQA